MRSEEQKKYMNFSVYIFCVYNTYTISICWEHFIRLNDIFRVIFDLQKYQIGNNKSNTKNKPEKGTASVE